MRVVRVLCRDSLGCPASLHGPVIHTLPMQSARWSRPRVEFDIDYSTSSAGNSSRLITTPEDRAQFRRPSCPDSAYENNPIRFLRQVSDLAARIDIEGPKAHCMQMLLALITVRPQWESLSSNLLNSCASLYANSIYIVFIIFSCL